MMERVDAIVPSRGSENLAATLLIPRGVVSCAFKTLRAKRKVMELTTVKITWDHHENQDEARSTLAVW